MSDGPDGNLLEAVTEVAQLAGQVALGYFRSRIDVEIKGDGSPVTIADRAAEQAARTWIADRFPGDGVLGEELGAVNEGARRRWLLDPIDGTKTFVRGVPLWGTLVAVVEEERVLAGAIFCPAVDEMVAAAPGRGCWWNGARCTVSSVGELSRATVLVTDDRFSRSEDRRARWTTLAGRAAVARTWGDCYGYLLLATGRAEVMADDRMAPWDAAALEPVIVEAGGVFTDWTGRPTAFGGDVIATNARLAAEARAILGALPAEAAIGVGHA